MKTGKNLISNPTLQCVRNSEHFHEKIRIRNKSLIFGADESPDIDPPLTHGDFLDHTKNCFCKKGYSKAGNGYRTSTYTFKVCILYIDPLHLCVSCYGDFFNFVLACPQILLILLNLNHKYLTFNVLYSSVLVILMF